MRSQPASQPRPAGRCTPPPALADALRAAVRRWMAANAALDAVYAAVCESSTPNQDLEAAASECVQRFVGADTDVVALVSLALPDVGPDVPVAILVDGGIVVVVPDPHSTRGWCEHIPAALTIVL